MPNGKLNVPCVYKMQFPLNHLSRKSSCREIHNLMDLKDKFHAQSKDKYKQDHAKYQNDYRVKKRTLDEDKVKANHAKQQAVYMAKMRKLDKHKVKANHAKQQAEHKAK